MTYPVQEKTVNHILFSTDKTKLDVSMIHQFLREAYWSKNLPLDILETAIRNSLCVGVYYEGKQVAFARYITDYCTFAYLADVFVLPEYRGRGISKQLMEFMLGFDFIKGLRRILLGTRDAHGLYEKYGFSLIEKGMMMGRKIVTEYA